MIKKINNDNKKKLKSARSARPPREKVKFASWRKYIKLILCSVSVLMIILGLIKLLNIRIASKER